LAGFSGRKDELISLLQYYQKSDGYISQERVRQIADFLEISEAQIFGVASFYTVPLQETRREYSSRLSGYSLPCTGRGTISVEIQNMLGIGPGEITPGWPV
jgi:NADH:ubiquinone oxidoreductase subunit E